MLTRGAARRGGMPLYKFVGNKILSRVQNLLSGPRLSEWHSGYRIYRVAELDRVRFLNNSNGFSFDTDVITQFLSAGSRIAELPIPTYYGDEICRVEGIRYAAQVIRSCLRHALHRFHVRPVRALMPRSRGNVQYDAKVEFTSSHTEAHQAHPAPAAGFSISAPARACSRRPSPTAPRPWPRPTFTRRSSTTRASRRSPPTSTNR